VPKKRGRQLKQKETDLLKAGKELLEFRGWVAYRTNNVGIYNPKSGGFFFHGTPGFPDMVALKPNYPILFLEFKTKGGRLTEHQKNFMKLVKETWGGRGAVIRELKSLKYILDVLDKQFNY